MKIFERVKVLMKIFEEWKALMKIFEGVKVLMKIFEEWKALIKIFEGVKVLLVEKTIINNKCGKTLCN